MSTIYSIVRELEQIPEPMQLNVLEFIRSLANSHTAANQAETTTKRNKNHYHSGKRRTTSALIAGKGKTLGDIVSPIVDEQDWKCLK
jgi:hypothetical protein